MTDFRLKPIVSGVLLFFAVHCLVFTAFSHAEYDGDYFSVYFTKYNTSTPEYSTEDNANNLAHLQALVDLIDSANSTIDVATYELNKQEVIDALKAAEDRGVTINIIYDATNYDKGDDAVSTTTLTGSSHKRRYSASFLSHNKYMIVDSTRIWTGSTNFTPEGFGSNTNNSILLKDCPGLIANYQQDFNEMWVNAGSTDKTSHGASYTVDGVSIKNYFSPKDYSVSNHLKTEVENAPRSVLFLITFGITQSDLLSAMKSKWDTFRSNGSGVMEGVIWKTGRNPYTDWDIAGMDVRNDNESNTLHSKLMIIDTSKIVTGSTNWSAAGDSSNDENMLIINDPVLACAYLREFRRIYDNTSDQNTPSVTPDSPSRPAAVTGLDFNVSPTGSNVTIEVSWSEPVESEFGRYYVYVETYNFSSAVYQTLPENASITDKTTVNLSFDKAGNTTYYCMVNYVSNYGVESDASPLMTILPSPPEAISTLSGIVSGEKGDIMLSWVSPHEFQSDPASGACEAYIIKYATGVFNNYSDGIASKIEISTAPQSPGTTEYFTLNFPDGLNYIAVFGRNSNGVIGEISNLISVYAVDRTSPAFISDTSVLRTGSNGLYLTWTMPGDNGNEGAVSSCQIIYATNSYFSGASTKTVTQSPDTLSLSAYTRYWVKVSASDEAGNTSSSTIVSCYTGTNFINTPSFSDSVSVSTSPSLDVTFKIEIDTVTAGSPGNCVELWDTRDNLGVAALTKLATNQYQVTASSDGRGFTVSPGLAHNHKYEIVISSSLKDIDGQQMIAETTYNFVTLCSPTEDNIFIGTDGSSVTVASGQFSSPASVSFISTLPANLNPSQLAAYDSLAATYTVTGAAVRGFTVYPGTVTAVIPVSGGIPYVYNSDTLSFEKALSYISNGEVVFEAESPAVWLFVTPDSFTAKKAAGVYAYPVPATGNKITFTNLGSSAEISVFTISGKCVLRENVTPDPVNGEWVWNFTSVSPGLYLWVVDGTSKGMLMIKR